MLSTATTSVDQAANEIEYIAPRRIRHITEIQIRNLTPFPVRDAVTTALSQPTEQSQFAGPGVVDDLGAITSRKHTRKASISSNATRLNLKWEEGIPEQPDRKVFSETRGRRTSTSSTIHPGSLNASTSSVKSMQPSSSSRSARSLRGHRPRTSSTTSANSNKLAASLFAPGDSSASLRQLLSDNSQANLEKIINSRMVETFIAVSIPNADNRPETSRLPANDAHMTPRSAPLEKPVFPSNSRMNKLSSVSPSTKRTHAPISAQRNRASVPASAPPSKTTFQNLQDTKPKSRQTTKSSGLESISPSSVHRETSAGFHSKEPLLDTPDTPVYFSPVHRPSTNPLFVLDARSFQGLSRQCDTSGQSLMIEVWGKVPGDEKNTETFLECIPGTSSQGHQFYWKLLDQKEVNLDKLLPLPDDPEANQSQLPSNTILITLSPPGQTFYLPPTSSNISRPNSPTGVYTSDPESEIRKAKQAVHQSTSETEALTPAEILPLSRRRRHPGQQGSVDPVGRSKTATMQDLFNLVDLQSRIVDNESDLREVVRKINVQLDEDVTFRMRRDISERESLIQDVAAKHRLVVDQISQKKLQLSERAEQLKMRSKLLASARDAISFDAEIDDRILAEKNRLAALHTSINCARTALLSTLSTIFPIDLYSPPDLLYTILDVPLPIPIGLNEPGPPLLMSDHKEVTEDAVATALGFVAQVLQILAAYMGKALIYPVTCVGSRSLIRDGISAMVGPRMFPLFSKGVDTYRFEYGVFLLNKDIEMLMSERDLRALDMRHTLPNLKNLLLTLSHDHATQHRPITMHALPPSTSPTGLQTPVRTPSPENDHDNIQTPKPSHIGLDNRSNIEGVATPTASGATTPTASTLADDSRKQRSFLGFAPFTDFLRSRYPSTTTNKSKPTSDTDEDSQDEMSDDESEGIEEDRQTIHASAPDAAPTAAPREGAIVAEI